MLHNARNPFIVLALLALAGCATRMAVTGDTRAGATLQSDVAQHVSNWAKVETGCKQVDAIQTQLLRENPIGTGKSAAARQYGSVDERWTVQLCGKTIPFAVTLTPDGKGGTFFSTSRER